MKRSTEILETLVGTVIILGLWWWSGWGVGALAKIFGALLLFGLLVCLGVLVPLLPAAVKEHQKITRRDGLAFLAVGVLVPGFSALMAWAFTASLAAAGIAAAAVIAAGLILLLGGVFLVENNPLAAKTLNGLSIAPLAGAIVWWLSGGDVSAGLVAGGGFAGMVGLFAAAERAKQLHRGAVFYRWFGVQLAAIAFNGLLIWYLNGTSSDFISFSLLCLPIALVVSIVAATLSRRRLLVPIIWLLGLVVLYNLFPQTVGAVIVVLVLVALAVAKWMFFDQGESAEQKAARDFMRGQAQKLYGNRKFMEYEELREITTPIYSVTGIVLAPSFVGLGGFAEYTGGQHLLTIAPTGAGKGVSAIIPNLLTYPGSALVIDPKGENAAVTARRRRAMGQAVYLLDPWEKVAKDGKGAAINPLDTISADNPNFLEDAALLADALAVPPGGRADPHWYIQAQDLLQGLILYVGFMEKPENRNLLRVRELLSLDTESFVELLEAMQAVTVAGGAISRAAGRMLSKAEKELSSILSTAQGYTKFLESNRIASTLTRSTFNPLELHRGFATVYVILPAEHLGTYAGWLRLMISHFKGCIAGASAQPKRKILFIIDEAATVGNLRAITDSLALMRGYGIQLWPFFQDYSQLKNTYGELADTFFANSAVKQIFGVNDAATAKKISDELGQFGTVADMRAYQPPDPKNPERPRDGHGFQMIQRPLMSPDDLTSLDPLYQVVMIQGQSPMKIPRIFYFENKDMADMADPNPYRN